MKADAPHDVVIVGGGPAGLSAAMLLGRSLRNVVICDAARPRNERSPAMHGFLGFDGISPRRFLYRARTQLWKYATVSYLKATIEDVAREGTLFVVREAGPRTWRAKAVLLTTGLVDRLPDIPNIHSYYGTAVHHCPYCDAWENRGKVLGVIGTDDAAVQLALELRLWSRQIILFTNEPGDAVKAGEKLGRSRVRLVTGRIAGLQGTAGAENRLESVCLENGDRIDCRALFFSPDQVQHSSLAQRLGCRVQGSNVDCDASGAADVPGLFVAGNATQGVQMAIVAASEGLRTAVAINNWLMDFDASYLSPDNSPTF